jgi:hypothetical protein
MNTKMLNIPVIHSNLHEVRVPVVSTLDIASYRTSKNCFERTWAGCWGMEVGKGRREVELVLACRVFLLFSYISNSSHNMTPGKEQSTHGNGRTLRRCWTVDRYRCGATISI